MVFSPPGSSVHGTFQARILEGVAISFTRASSQTRDRTRVSCTAGRFFTDWTTLEAQSHSVESTFCDPMDCSLPGSSGHGILQARILKWVAVPFSRGSSQPRDWTQVSHISSVFFTACATREAYNLSTGPVVNVQRMSFWHQVTTACTLRACWCCYFLHTSPRKIHEA